MAGSFRCRSCNVRFTTRKDFLKHVRKHKVNSFYYCQFCPSLTFKRKKAREIHLLVHRCENCGDEFQDLAMHRRTCEEAQVGHGDLSYTHLPFQIENEAFQGFLKGFRHRTEDLFPTSETYFIEFGGKIQDIIKHNFVGRKPLKAQFVMVVEFLRELFNDQEEKTFEKITHYVNSDLCIILNTPGVRKAFKKLQSQINSQIELFEKNGSGWRLNRIVGFDIKLAVFDLFQGGCKMNVPAALLNKRAVINTSVGSNCFVNAFVIGKHLREVNKRNRHKFEQYRKFENQYCWTGITFPTPISFVKKFEKKNNTVAINVFGWDPQEDNPVNILYRSPGCSDKSKQIVNLLYLVNPNCKTGHWMAVSSLSRLTGSANRHQRVVCYNCLNSFTKLKIEEHQKLCFQFKCQRVILPQKDKDGNPPICRFTDIHKRMKVRYVMYCDFEALNVPSTGPDTTNSKRISDHVPSGYSITVIDTYNEEQSVYKHEVHRGKDPIKKFTSRINQIALELKDNLNKKEPMQRLTLKQTRKHYESNICHICKRAIYKHEVKVRDHCHISGDYRGPAHFQCNAKFTHIDKIPVCFHNFRGYDSQLLIDNLKRIYNRKVVVIPYNTEKFTSIITNNYIIMDTYLHTTSSLDGMVNSLDPINLDEKDFIKKFKPMVDVFGYQKAKLLARKGVYMYEYFDCFDRFEETSFPSRASCYSKLRSKNISQEDHAYGSKIFHKFCKTLGDYHDLYLETDTLLLASCFENFRELARKHYGLDPLHYLSLPGLAWDAALFNTNASLELITDEKIYYMLELALRGGVCMISERYAEANNQFMPPNLRNPDDPNSFLFYIDKNNLYGEALCDFLPVGNFRLESVLIYGVMKFLFP